MGGWTDHEELVVVGCMIGGIHIYLKMGWDGMAWHCMKYDL